MATGKDFGGRMIARAADGTQLSLRGTFNVSPSTVSIEAVANQNGSVDRVATPVPATAEIVIRDDVDANALLLAPRQSITVIEEFGGVTHYFTDAFFSGRPSSNRNNGELSGLVINTEQYNRGAS